MYNNKIFQIPGIDTKSNNPKNERWDNNIYPKVSIVMPVYNQMQFIERSILSVLNQGYPNLELIVIDGGSTDGSVEIIKKYESRITYWHSGPDKGQSDALNTGFSKANGEVYGWLNSDDIYCEDAIIRCVNALRTNYHKKIVFGDWVNIDVDDNVISREYAYDVNVNHIKYEGVSLNAQAMFWLSEVHHRFGEFDVGLYNTMDYEMILSFLLKEKSKSFIRIPFVIGGFRRYPSQKTGLHNYERQHAEHMKISSKFGYSDKYSFTGRIKRFIYRFRRGYWYIRRAGFAYFIDKLFNAEEFSLIFKKG
jgi:glycosyltransferase involved in cell wall biosynthesis